MPVRIGRWANGNNAAQKVVGLFTSKGRRVRSDRIGGFLLMWVLACLRPLRRRLYRHETETAFLNRSLQRALKAAPANPALAIEVLKCQRLIKGYSDTHARGHSKYDRIMDAVDLLERRPDAADWVRRLRDAALLDENGTALDGAIKTIGTFAEIGTDD